MTAPDDVRQRLRGLSSTKLIAACAALRPDRDAAADPLAATQIALRCLARRHQQLSTEIADLDELLEPLVTAINPRLAAAHGVGTDTAGQLLVTAGENHDRLHGEAAFAMLCGVAPIPASSGKTTRHRLNRGGDRQANAALYRVVLCRLRWDPRTRAYMERRTQDGLSRKRSSAASSVAGRVYAAVQWPTRWPASEPPGAHVAGGEEDKEPSSACDDLHPVRRSCGGVTWAPRHQERDHAV
ncbi:MAG TPA: transposase [Nonomuraea sp.]|nr:transposase [Nonomuraea sp.]